MLWLGVTRQALADRERRGTLLACRTADGHLVYPVLQFGRNGQVRPGVVDAVGILKRAGADGWAIGAWLTTATAAFDGDSAVDYLVVHRSSKEGRRPGQGRSLSADAAGWAEVNARGSSRSSRRQYRSTGSPLGTSPTVTRCGEPTPPNAGPGGSHLRGRPLRPDPPHGTCYLASSRCRRPPRTTRRRFSGPGRSSRRRLLEDVVVSTLHLPQERDVADVESQDATQFGVTRELETMVPYAVPQALGARVRRHGNRGSGVRPAVHDRRRGLLRDLRRGRCGRLARRSPNPLPPLRFPAHRSPSTRPAAGTSPWLRPPRTRTQLTGVSAKGTSGSRYSSPGCSRSHSRMLMDPASSSSWAPIRTSVRRNTVARIRRQWPWPTSATLPFSSVGMRSRSTPAARAATASTVSPGVSPGDDPVVEDRPHVARAARGSRRWSAALALAVVPLEQVRVLHRVRPEPGQLGRLAGRAAAARR